MDTKRALDVIISALALMIAAPLLVAIALAMRLSGDGRSMLYRAHRVGKGGAPIIVLKIRTMSEGPTGLGVTGREDPRVTRLGRSLRRHRLDELPQLINVLRGDMSIVGPRPEDPRYIDWSDPVHRRVFSAKPGITGLAQLEFRDESDLLVGPDIDEQYRREILPAKLRLDVEYLDHHSTLLDVRIMARTIGLLVRSLSRP